MHTFLHAQQTQWAVDNDMKKLAADQLPYLPATSRSWMRRTARAMLLVLLTQTVLPAFAQSLPLTANTQAPAGQRPILDAAANGVPIIHIAPPSAAGVSRNQYDQFNVNTNGLILNNSAANVQTAQGGWISGNPQLGATPARIILNEVVSTHASQLRGTIEVAGRRADIVVANPNGIACDGCGFLNSGRATLTTGRPQFGADGALNGFDVRQGELNIGAGGLNASNLEQLDLIARGIVIEGEVWAKNLNAIAGGNQVLYGTLHSTAQGTAGTAPKFAIDIKSVGGMYATQIYMIGTEQGLGVNSAGRLAALQGNLVLSANGDLTLQETYAKKNIQIDSAGNVKLAGQTMSEGSIAVTTAGQLDNHGVTDALERLTLHSVSLNNTGTLVQRGADNATLSVTGQLRNSGTLYSAGQLDMSAASISDLNGRMQISGDLRLQAQQIELTGTQIATNGSAWLDAGAGITAQQSDIHAAADLNATAGTAIVNMNGTWQAAGNASIAGAMFTNLNSTVLVNGHLNVTASGSMANNNSKLLAGRNLALDVDSLTNDGGQIVTDANGSVRFGRALTNENGIISAKNGLQITTIGGSINNAGGGLVSDAALFIAGGELNNTGGLIASGGQQNGALSIHVSGISNRYGTVDAAGTLNVRSTDVIDNAYGVLQSGSNSALPDGSARIESAVLLNNGGGILARDTLTVVSGELNNDLAGTQQGRIASAAGNVSVQAAQASNVGGLITAAGESALRTQSLNNTGGEISAGTLLSLDTGNSKLLNDGGNLLAGGNLAIRAGAISNKARSGTAASIAAAGNVSIQGAGLSNDGSSVSAGQSASIVVDALSNLGGAIEAQGLIAVSANLLDNRAGAVIANDAVSLEVQSVDNTDGVISADKGVSVNSAGALVNARGQIVSNGSVAIVAASLANSAGVVSAKESRVQLGAGVLDNMQGQLIGSQALTIQSGEIRNAAGMIASGTDLALDTQGQSLDNAGGQILADGELRIDSARLYNSAGSMAAMTGKLTIDTHGQDLVNNDGKLQAQGDLSLAAGSFLNQKGVVAGQQVTARTGSFDNGAGEVTAGGDLEITSQALRNDAGLLQAAGKVTIDTQGQSLVNINSGSGAGIVAGGELSIVAGSLDNKTGFVGSDGSQTLTVAGTLDNRAADGQASELVANANSTIIAANVLNSGGRINTLGDMAVTTGDLDNRAGRMTAGGEVALALTTLDNSVQGTAGGAIDAKNISVNATSIDNKGGAIRADNDATINAPILTNVGGNITAKANLSVAAASLSNTGGKLVGDAGVTISTSSVSPGGTIASVNNVTLNIGGNYSNSGLLSAQRNLTLNAANITNTGTLTAGDVLTANTGSFTNFGEISAYTTNLNVSDTLTNTVSGLIDGVYTNINAGTINNTGRIYGDVLKTKGNTVNNSGTGVIAARDNLLIGARNVNNTDGGLLYSLGDIAMAGSFDGNLNAVGEMQKLVNGSAKIEAANNIRLAVKDLINRNDGLVTRTETTSIPVNRLLIQRYASSDLTKYDASELGWVSPSRTVGRHGGYALPSTKYPFATFGSNLKDEAFLYDWESGGIYGFRYAANDPIWALMGVAPPQSSDLSPAALTLPLTFNGFIDCVNIEPTVCRDSQTWQQRVVTQSTALNEKITAFNNDLNSRSFNDWYEDTITRQDITETVVDSTRPAQILAGGAISVASSGSILNDNSNIVAGGAIGITGATIENRGTEGTKAVTDVGTRIIRYVATFGNGGDLHMGSLGPITGAPVVTTKTLQSFVYQSNGVNPTTSRGLNTQTTGPSGAKSETPQGASGQSRTINVVAVNTSLPAVTAASNADTAPPTIQTLKLAGVGAQAPSLVLTTLPRMSAPSNSLFVLHPEPGARYLVETDSRFTNYRTFLSSDYFLQTLNRDPERQLKRYGDGFYEQQLVNDQILALTGRRYLSGYSDTQSEYQALMDAGIAFARQYQLSPGVALTAEQMALLTTDVVLLTTQTVTLPDGTDEQVLVPQVYLRRPQEGDLLPSGGLIAGSDVYIKSAGDLVNSGQIAANNETTLLAGNDLLNRGGRISGQDVYARAGNDLKNISGSIQGTGTDSNVALSAGRDIILETRTIAGQTARTATTAATTRVNADRIATVQGGTVTIEAARDLIGKGSAVQAEMDLVAVAGRDIKISAVESSYTYNEKTGSRVTKGRSGYIKEESVTNELATFDAGNNLALVAGASGKGDAVLSGVNATAGGNAVIQGSNITIEAVKNSKLEDFQTVSYQYYRRDMKSDETVVGGAVSAGDNLTIRATGAPDTTATAGGMPVPLVGSGDVRLTGAYLQSQDGQVSVMANNDVTIDAIKTEHATAFEYYKKTKSLFKTKTVTQTNFTNTQQAEGSVISGDSVLIQAGNQVNRTGDVTIKASQVVADNDLQISAGLNLNIETEQVQSKQVSTYEKKVSGLFSGGGLSVTIGKQQTNQNGASQSTSHVGSVVGSVGGDVSLSAGNQYRQVGSDVVAPAGDINIAARQVDIGAATDDSNSEQQTKFKQSGLTLAISSPVLSALQTVQQMSQAASKTKDGRMQALAGASAALAVNNGYDAIQKGQGSVINGKENQIATGTNADGSTASRDANAADKAGGINLSISIGGSKSQSQSMQAETNAVGSNVTAGGDVRIVASGGGADSDLTIEGSNVKAGSNVLLQADDAVNLLAAKSTAEQHSSNKSSSGSIGISFGTSGFGVTASASKGRGKADGSDVSWTNTHVEAGNVLAVQSGGDTMLKGAVAQGDQVIAQVGGDLIIESLQDTSKYDSKQQNVGGSITIGAGVSGNISYSKSKVNSDYASVTEQSGIKAGDGGFQVVVADATTLTGGAITSTQKAIDEQKNDFRTGGELTLSDIENHASYSAKSVGVNVGSGFNAQGKLAPQGTGVGIGSDSGNANSTTLAAISGIAGNKDARTGDGESGIGKIFDADKVQQEIDAQVTITQTFGQLASKAVGDYAGKKLKEADALRVQAASETDDIRASQLRAQADEIDSQWGEQGTLRLLAHTVVGGLTGGASGTAGAAAGTFTAPLVADSLKNAGIDGPLATTLTALASTAAGAAVGGAQGAGTALNEVANNFLSHEESSRRLRLKDEKNACRDDACRTEKQREINRLDQLDAWRDQQIAQACQSPASSGCQAWTAAIQVAAKSYYGQYGNYVDTAERASVLNKAFEYQQAANNPFLHGIGKGLLKITPPGMAVGAVGGIGALVQSLVESGASQTLANIANGIKEFPDDLKARLNSSDPTIRGEAIVDFATLAMTGATLTAGAVKYSVNAMEKAAIARAVAKAEEEAVAKTIVDLNLYRDWPVASDMVQYRINQLAERATHNPDANTVVLGKHIAGNVNSYEQVAKAKGATYFELPGTSWSEAVTQLGVDKMWSVNKKFLDDQIYQGKQFVFTLDPRTVDANSFTAKEYAHLLQNSYRLIEESGGGYRAVKK